MAVLEIHSRPWTVFDPDNRDHRRYYSRFLKEGGWGSCPVRFVAPDGSYDLLTMIRSSLVQYYIKKEFRTTTRRTQS